MPQIIVNNGYIGTLNSERVQERFELMIIRHYR